MKEVHPIEPNSSSSELKSSIQQKAENSTLGGGMQSAAGDHNNQNQSNSSSNGNIVNLKVSVGPQIQAIGSPIQGIKESSLSTSKVLEPNLSSRRILLGCSFHLIVLGSVVSITLFSIGVRRPNPPRHPTLESPRPPETLVEDDPFWNSIDYQELESLLGKSKWEEADLKTRSILLSFSDSQEKDFLTVIDFNRIPCTSLYLIDELWWKYSYGRFGFNTQSKIWERSGGNYLIFSHHAGWLNSGLWSVPQGFRSGSLPRASWWRIMDKSEGAKAVFYKIRKCERGITW